MNNIEELIERCQEMGATFTLLGNQRISVKASNPLPDEIMDQLRAAKQQIMSELLGRLKKQAGCWFLEEWRRTSLPSWRRILKESIESSNKHREEYARWMLKEILEDPEYREEE